ncbi:MAG: RNA polymerase sigma factor [Candidatus Kapaibacterium sp.]
MEIKEKQEQFLCLLEPVRRRLSLFARAMTRNDDDARDLMSETILLAYENFEKIRDRQAFPAYLFSIASRLRKRNMWRARIFGGYDEEMAANMPDGGQSPESRVDIAALYEALAKLPRKQHEAIVLFEISGFTLNEIQEIQGGSLSGVKSRLRRGRQRLAELLGATDADRSIDLRAAYAPSDENDASQLKVSNNYSLKV